jgi:two-component system NtrC family sensor kinase
LGQVMANLIQNTLVHGFDGRDSGVVAIRATQEGNYECTITVQDDGVGMNDEVRQRVFEPFFTTKANRGGSGVGLALCKRLVEETLRGTITVASELDQGTRFTIVIPNVVP